MKAYIKHILIILTSGTLLSCAGADQRPLDEPADAVARGSDCISQGTIRDYRVLDDRNLIVSTGPRQRYHVQLANPVFGLRSTMKIGFEVKSGQICPGFDYVIVDTGFRPEGYRIYSIDRLSPEEYDAVLVRYGAKEPDPEQVPAPEEVEGAEVEELD